MLDKFMGGHRGRIVKLLWFAVALTFALAMFGPTESRTSGLLGGVVGLVLLPLVYYGVYFILYLQVKNYYMSTRTLRHACGLFLFFFGGVTLFTPLFSLYSLIRGWAPLPPLVFGLGPPLAAFRIWARYLEHLDKSSDGLSRLANYSMNPPAGGCV